MKGKLMHIRVSPGLHQDLRILAAETGISIAQVCCILLSFGMRNKPARLIQQEVTSEDSVCEIPIDDSLIENS